MTDRAIVIVLDSVGLGELPDSADYGDTGVNTLGHTAEAVGGLHLPNMAALGLGNITPIRGVAPMERPIGCYGKMAEVSKGKDTVTGHWEMMGVTTETPFPTYPNGFPEDIIREFEARIGRGTLGNVAASGTEIIKELGEEHVHTGRPIVYTSADSVFQVAAHEDVISVEELYRICSVARGMLAPPHHVQRVIARPFIGEPGSFTRTGNRRDFALQPHSDTLLDLVVRKGGTVTAIGKIEDIFAGRGVTTAIHPKGNAACIDATISAIFDGQNPLVRQNHTRDTLLPSLIFTNLVDFDMVYGHRNDPEGYTKCLCEFDEALPRIMSALMDNDILVITADHGCDPTTPGTDHTREYVPLLVYGKCIPRGVDLGTRSTFCDLAATLADLFGISGMECGASFASLLEPGCD